MQHLAVSKFNALCVAVRALVGRVVRTIAVARLGKPVAETTPLSPRPRPPEWLGSLRATGSIRGDIVTPASDPNDWTAAERTP